MLKGLIFVSFHLGWCGSLQSTNFQQLSLMRCGGLERTDFWITG